MIEDFAEDSGRHCQEDRKVEKDEGGWEFGIKSYFDHDWLLVRSHIFI